MSGNGKTLGICVNEDEYGKVNGLCERLQVHVSCALRERSLMDLLDLYAAVNRVTYIPKVYRRPRVGYDNCDMCDS